MKTATVFLMSLLILASLCTAEEVKMEKPFKYSCIRFDQKGKVGCEGTITAKQFHKWFETVPQFMSCPPAVSKDATVFGVLVLTDGDKILTMPLYAWHGKEYEGEYCLCKSYSFGSSPAFLPPTFMIGPRVDALLDSKGNAVPGIWHLTFGGQTATREGFLEEVKQQLIRVSMDPSEHW